VLFLKDGMIRRGNYEE